ncbi:MAG: 2-C-methyl-D-erythritol 4-phosphate cytidylyltransferase [Proteobacteria bacterium]|nr:2-C-methyl-D-erythritol 4-phosphate cytidylyltransferase [Pseudomonadota bacterium]
METLIPFSVVFLAGGTGTRMKSSVPKQYLCVHQKPLALYSFEVLASLPEIQDFVVVCEPQYESLFQGSAKAKEVNLRFARPGLRRQDSVLNGIQDLQHNPLVCIHDSARPLIEHSVVRRVVQAAESWETAVVGVKVRSTIKICDGAQIVVDTPNRASLWEVQTPQVIRLDLLKEGFAHAQEHYLTVTDDVSLIEALGKPVKVVEGSYSNIKVTTPEDLICVENLMNLFHSKT